MAGEVAAALDSTAAAHVHTVRNLALERGWPEDVAASLTLERDGNRLRIGWPEEMTQRVQDLEYGTQERAPISVIPAALRGIKPDAAPIVEAVRRILR